MLEFDAPNILLSDSNSQFASLLKQTGPAEAEYLRTLVDVASSISVKLEHERFNPINELPVENTESDALLSSHIKIQ